jgi:hypothetical protein
VEIGLELAEANRPVLCHPTRNLQEIQVSRGSIRRLGPVN